MARIEILPFADHHLDAAGQLLADRHRAHRRRQPALDAAFEDRIIASEAIAELLAKPDMAAFVAVRDRALIGYLVGAGRDPQRWGSNVWVEGAGHAATDAEAVRAMYAAAAGDWLARGRPQHYVIAPVSDEVLVDAWFSMEFGIQHIHAIRDVPGMDFQPEAPPGVAVRAAVANDMPALAELDVALAAHSAEAPVFFRGRIPTVEESLAELVDEGLDDPRFVEFVAEREGRVVGSIVGCAIDESKEHFGIVRPPGVAFLGFAAVRPDARGFGAGRALSETLLVWARDAGFSMIATDWRSTNLQANRTWRGLGFRPIFYRLHRAIA